jgi:hypothetical protein
MSNRNKNKNGAAPAASTETAGTGMGSNLAAGVAASLAASAPPAKGPTSPVHQVAMQQKASVTPKGRKSKAEAITGRVASGWHIRSVVVDGGLEVIFITQANFVDDGYGIVEVTKFLKHCQENGEFDHPIMQIGLLGQYFMRKSLQDPDRLLERKGPYQRKCLVRVLDPGEEAPKHRFAALKVVKEFLQDKRHNQYDYPVHLNEDNFDRTPSVLPKIDHYVQYTDIVKIVYDLFKDVDSTWAANNIESALAYFTEGYIPYEACQDVGFPEKYVTKKTNGMNSTPTTA